jgi:hypothetical protein
LWISAHADLLGDPLLGREQQQRFLPTRFNIDCNALDGKGFVCRLLACPHCHLAVPRALLEAEPLFVSILGTPACGKSYYLTALTWQLRQVLPKEFAVAFGDADPSSNRVLTEYEELLFLNQRADETLPVADLIRKTELQGDLYDTVTYGNQAVSYPRPFLFTIHPQDTHPKRGAGQLTRLLCLYDNAGEHFQPGQESTASPVTQHLARSRTLLFLFDPTQDQRFREAYAGRSGGAPPTARTSRQESVMHEVATRVRRYTGLPVGTKHARPLIVIVTKLDAWKHLLPDQDVGEPWARTDWLSGLDMDKIEKRSRDTREVLARLCSEFVGAAEDFAQNVLYVPVSALGQSPTIDPTSKRAVIRPRDIRPAWVTVPLLYGLSKEIPALVLPMRRRTATQANPAAGGVRTNPLPDK